MSLSLLPWLIVTGAGLLGGVSLGLFWRLVVLPRRLRQLPIERNIESILQNAKHNRQVILDEAKSITTLHKEEKLQSIEKEHELLVSLQEKYEKDLNERQSEIDKKENVLNQKFLGLQDVLDNAQTTEANAQKAVLETKNVKNSMLHELEKYAQQNISEVTEELKESTLSIEKMEAYKSLNETMENLKKESQIQAQRILNSVHFRYQPKFVWPKIPFSVSVPSHDIIDKYLLPSVSEMLTTGTDTTIGFMSLAEAQEQGVPQGPSHSFYVKVSGGLGVDKEVIRLTLEELFSKKLQDEGSIQRAIEKNRKRVNQLIVRLGNEAAKKLDLKGIHPEIIKLIGSLNYRTSHRQNQYYHSLEVATLAGLIAMELGVDPQLARRAGILHDIGKVLDYRIEGSHAVISGDYAANFGENTDVVDTVLSHHDDKVVETPHAYILKTADALSGARPGARVDMEEGYVRRMDGISGVVNSFQDAGVLSSVIMHAGREVHVFVDSHKVQQVQMESLATNIARKLEDEVEYPGQIRVTIIRRTEIAEVA